MSPEGGNFNKPESAENDSVVLGQLKEQLFRLSNKPSSGIALMDFFISNIEDPGHEFGAKAEEKPELRKWMLVEAQKLLDRLPNSDDSDFQQAEKLLIEIIEEYETKTGETFARYQKDFGFDLYELAQKSTLDVGCGPSALFLKYCLKHGIKNIIGMDERPPADIKDEMLNGHYVQGNILHLPFKTEQFNLILVRALPVSLKEVKLLLPLLKPNGEIKISPLEPENNKAHKEFIDEIMAKQGELKFTASFNQVGMQPHGYEEHPRYTLIIKSNK